MIEETIVRVKQAESEGDAKIADAKKQAAAVRSKAQDDAAKIIEDAEEAARKTVAEAEAEIARADTAAADTVQAKKDNVLSSVREEAAAKIPEAAGAVKKFLLDF